MGRHRHRGAKVAAGYAACYIGSAWLLSSSVFPSGFSPWYPPAGLTLAFLLLMGVRPGPVVFVACVRMLNTWVIFPDAWRDEADGVIARAVTVTACYAAAAWALRRVGLHHARLRELGWFAVLGVAGAPFGASLCVALVEVGLLGRSGSSAFDAALTFWVGDAVAIASIVPVVLLVAGSIEGIVTPPRLPQSTSARVETALQAAALILVPVIAIAVSRSRGQTALLALAIVPAIWVALRRDLVLAAFGLFLLTATLSTAAAVILDADITLVELQTVLLAAALAGLYVAAATHSHEMAIADLIESEHRYRSVVGSAPDLVARFDDQGTLRFASEPAWLADAGGAEAVLAGLQGTWDVPGSGVGAGHAIRTVEWEQAGPDGLRTFTARLAPERLADGRTDGVVAVVTDMTPQRRAEAEHEEARRRDPLTGLRNRNGLLELVASIDPDAVAERLAVIVVDLDNFKSINGVLGHDQGDDVLRCVADRLRAAHHAPVAAARVGGDEFALTFLVDGGDDRTARATADSLLASLSDCIPLGGDDHRVTASIGVALGGPPGVTAEGVFCDAETAMHAAKESGRNRVAHFDAHRRSVTADRRWCESLLRSRLGERDVVIHYQPAFDLESRRPCAVEALVRLRGPDGEIVMPDRFIPIAEETGLDVELGELVLTAALRQVASWPVDSLVAHVNVTARQLTRPGFATTVLEACAESGLSPDRLCLELTETLVMAEPEAAIAALTDLRAAGVGATLDDFGTGYSSVSYLSRLPVSGIKIDRSFVDGLPDDERSRAVVGLVAGLGRALELDVIAEGIETDEQVAALLDLGCTKGQGFLLARPAPAEELTVLYEGMVPPAPA